MSIDEASLRSGLRHRVVDFLAAHDPATTDRLEFLRARYDAGLAWVFFPEGHGGLGLPRVLQAEVDDLFAEAGAPDNNRRANGIGLGMAAPTILAFGTPEQKQRFLPRIYNGDDFWVQGYSEPGSGSDLASLKTRAVREGDHYVVTGQKIWTTLGHYGDWIFCLVRTDTKTEKRQDGISFLLVDMTSPGITVRPIVLMDQGHEVNEVFFDEVQVPAENLVHEEGKGWTVAKYLLGYERMGTGNIAVSKRELARVKDLAAKATKNGRPLLEDPRFRDRLSRVEVELMALEITNMRFLDQLRGGRAPGAEVSLLKIKGTEIQQAITELAVQTAGPFAQAFRPVNGDTGFDRLTAALVPRYCNVRKATIYAGSNEIQRNIIAKATLGL
jgi:alkylation response protein AidB-like acyl-CoA dehydrogenase